MRVAKLSWSPQAGLSSTGDEPQADLVLYFGARPVLAEGGCHQALREAFPGAVVVGCSTGGQSLGLEVEEDGAVGAALRFAGTRVRLATENAIERGASHACGRRLGAALAAPDLAGVLVLSDGLHVNGSALAAGITERLGPGVPVSGGLAGDGAAFAATLVGAGEAAPAERRVAAIGFYGPSVRFGHGSAGGWRRFGPERRITQADGPVLHELDGAPALDLYERYLGDEAQGLPGSALLFPLRIWNPARPGHELVRTVLGVDKAARSMTFAGDMPAGWRAQLMRGGVDGLVSGAAEAARAAAQRCEGAAGDGLALLVSCIGRRLLMGQRTAEEIEAVAAQFPPGQPILGFYSYGELSPLAASGHCELHNQTMTVTLLREAA
ncbi:FIST C-terminal domain-containing protein [Roseomonas sp. PWR1]|uniref:FIST C-terminal domain-containing protein n=1 Tax=Roseomonas nitratireducens TaxID=2820810 RepID=A0ABS4AMB7_9PROT|nr:FIST N-terminal domain-containing protein [Neoroseomonas nitratireducens]MBP0462374.1 FIST C-terminal domain-containing protein [Neoroseomonas nitratireducens]